MPSCVCLSAYASHCEHSAVPAQIAPELNSCGADSRGSPHNRSMDLDDISVFVKVVQAGSFSQAARLLGMPNTTVSAKVARLEQRLGVTLIRRTTRKLHVTPAGQNYFARCMLGIAEIETAEAEISSATPEPCYWKHTTRTRQRSCRALGRRYREATQRRRVRAGRHRRLRASTTRRSGAAEHGPV